MIQLIRQFRNFATTQIIQKKTYIYFRTENLNSQLQFQNKVRMLSEAEKGNLNKLLQKYSFEHLRPIPQVYEIIIPQTQHFINGSSSDKRRKIYYKVKYEMKQIEAIEEAKKQLKKTGVNDKLGDELILKHIYCGKWNMEKAVNRLKQVVEYHKDQSITKFNQQTIKKLEMGSIYSYGHDKGMRPVITMRVDKFNFKLPIQEHFNAVYYLMLVVLGYRMVPYHAEKYTMIMDFNDIAFADIPYMYLYDALQKMGIYYCGNSEKTLIYNSTGINNIWRVVSLFLPQNQKKKIVFISKGQQKSALQFIDEYELERKYGGKLPDLTQFWPPKSTNQQFNLSMMERQEEDLYSVQNDEEYFQVEDDKWCKINSCQCVIY